MSRGRFVYEANEAGTGFVEFSLDGLGKAIRELEKLPGDYSKAHESTLSDCRTKVPGIVSKAVATIYAIPESYVVAKRARKDAAGEYHRGRNSGKGNALLSIEGGSVASLSFIFRGRKDATLWPVYANGKKVTEKKKNKDLHKYKTKRVNGEKKKIRVPYEVSQETYKGKPATIKGKNGNRVFIVKGKMGKYMPVIARPKERKFLPHATSSVPQAIANPQVIAIWKPSVQTMMIERFRHNCERLKLI